MLREKFSFEPLRAVTGPPRTINRSHDRAYKLLVAVGVDQPTEFAVTERINTAIFLNPAALMENIQRVTAHVAARLGGTRDCERRVLTVIPNEDGHAFHRAVDGIVRIGLLIV